MENMAFGGDLANDENKLGGGKCFRSLCGALPRLLVHFPMNGRFHRVGHQTYCHLACHGSLLSILSLRVSHIL